MNFAQTCGVHGAEREAACEQAAAQIAASGAHSVRFSWCDLHGMYRGKTLMAAAAVRALRAGVGMVGTLMLKDTADRTAWKVFEAEGAAGLPGFAGASNLMLLPDPTSFTVLPWVRGHGAGCAASPGSPTAARSSSIPGACWSARWTGWPAMATA